MICKNDSRAQNGGRPPPPNNHEGIRVRVRVRVRVGLQRGVVSEKLTNVISQMSHRAKKHFKLACLSERGSRFRPKRPSSKLPFMHGFQWPLQGVPFSRGSHTTIVVVGEMYGFTGHPSSTEPDVYETLSTTELSRSHDTVHCTGTKREVLYIL